MKIALLSLTLTSVLLAQDSSLHSFSADFNQTIVDEHNKTITYTGSMISKRPNLALWKYEKPIEKTLYIYENVVTIVEPDMEQAIIKKIDKNIDIFQIMQNAEKIDSDHFVADYNDQKFLLTMKKELLTSISYSDELDNKVTINFSQQENNKELNNTIFRAVIPEDFDIVR